MDRRHASTGIAKRRAWAAAVAALLLTGCPEATSRLVVDVRAELVAGVEFTSVRTEVLTGATAGRFVEHAVEGEDYARGARVAELDGLARGDVTVRVTLLRAGATVMQRPVRVTLASASHAVTALFARECLGVECPIPGGDPVAAACVGGTCQDEGCTEETPELCAPECASAADCGSPSSCAVAECTASGSCFLVADDARCSAAETCDLLEGCVGGPPCDPFDGADRVLHVAEDVACVHASDRPLRCWGRNHGLFELPAGIHSESVQEILPAIRFSIFTLGSDFLCGVDATGATRCAGLDWAGQLGDGDGQTDLVRAPVSVAAPVPAGVDSIDASFATACASEAGFAWCWGHNDTGQTGNGRVQEAEWVPVEVGPGMPIAFTRMLAGHTHSCGLTGSGDLWCWGSNANEQLGRAPDMPAVALEPLLAPGPGGWLDASPGFEFTVAIDATGQLWSWGSNVAGQLGRDEALGGGTPDAGMVTTPPGLVFVDVEAGYRHACAITDEGRLFCWGDDTWNQLGPGSDRAFSEVPVEVLTGRPIVDVGVGASHSCALDDEGRAWCWGDNSYAQLSGPMSAGTSEPRPVCASP